MRRCPRQTYEPTLLTQALILISTGARSLPTGAAGAPFEAPGAKSLQASIPQPRPQPFLPLSVACGRRLRRQQHHQRLRAQRYRHSGCTNEKM